MTQHAKNPFNTTVDKVKINTQSLAIKLGHSKITLDVEVSSAFTQNSWHQEKCLELELQKGVRNAHFST
jgi:hypothetical protein